MSMRRPFALTMALVAMSVGASKSCGSAECTRGGDNSALIQLVPSHSTHPTRPGPHEQMAGMQHHIAELQRQVQDMENLRPSLLAKESKAKQSGQSSRRRKDDSDDAEYKGDLRSARYDLESFAEELNFKIDDLVGGEFCATKTCYVKGCAIYFGVTTFPGEILHFTMDVTEGDFQGADNTVNLTADSKVLAERC